MESADYPALFLQGDLFLVDLEVNGLVYGFDYSKIIRFSKMIQPGMIGHYRFLYDTQNKSIFRLPRNLRHLPPHVHLLEIPHKGALDPLRYHLQQGKPTDRIPDKWHYLGDCHRHAYPLTRVRLFTHEYFTDYRRQVFIDTTNLKHTISFKQLRETPEGLISCWYDPVTRKAGPPKNDSPAGNIVQVKLPHLKDIDPLGWHWLLQNSRTEHTENTVLQVRLTFNKGRQVTPIEPKDSSSKKL